MLVKEQVKCNVQSNIVDTKIVSVIYKCNNLSQYISSCCIILTLCWKCAYFHPSSSESLLTRTIELFDLDRDYFVINNFYVSKFVIGSTNSYLIRAGNVALHNF